MMPALPALPPEALDRMTRQMMTTIAEEDANPTPPLQRSPSPPTSIPRVKPPQVVTPMSPFGVRRIYPQAPTWAPASQRELKLRFNGAANQLVRSSGQISDIIQPYANFSSWLLEYHFYMHGNSVSEARQDALLECPAHPLFNQRDVNKKEIKAAREKLKAGFRPAWLSAPKWKHTTVTIYIPPHGAFDKEMRKKYVALQTKWHKSRYGDTLDEPEDAPLELGIPFRVSGLYFKPFGHVLKEALTTHPTAPHLHFMPFEEVVLKDTSSLFGSDDGDEMPPTPAPPPSVTINRSTPTESASRPIGPSINQPHATSEPLQPPFDRSDYERVHGEAYASKRYRQQYDELQELKWRIQHDVEFENHPNRACPLEWVAVGSIDYSDATIPYTFSHMKLWPVYRFMASLTKYYRGQASADAAEEMAFLPGVRSI
jgi:hypothetical protein